MAPSTPSQGLPSPPPRTPNTPSRAFPYTFIPHLPKVGTAKVRLRSNVFALCAYAIVWWQSSLYGFLKESVVLVIGGISSTRGVLKVFSWFENVSLFIILWNIVEAIFVINRTPPPESIPPSASAARTGSIRKPRGSSLRFLTTSQSQPTSPLSKSIVSPYLSSSLASSTATSIYDTPTRKGITNARTSLPFMNSASRFGLTHSVSTPVGLGASFDSSLDSVPRGDLSAPPLASHMGQQSPESSRPLSGEVLRKLFKEADS
ncbi:uncharacterized protein EI90DRAFT_3156074 [Cantharellus anzutake]|uniref:uncharacterized protein n=1 Tax=Cantharellus anzutake TaxID=1750568 RepID=UPI001905DDB3|nr:uncharacterized protein EI90DRAFT_3156074 [Cantharellus anzutake]KAF8327770.1 hypothetical protein EI90DRAFT_3156074 [Cantharellus anzutake]